MPGTFKAAPTREDGGWSPMESGPSGDGLYMLPREVRWGFVLSNKVFRDPCWSSVAADCIWINPFHLPHQLSRQKKQTVCVCVRSVSRKSRDPDALRSREVMVVMK